MSEEQLINASNLCYEYREAGKTHSVLQDVNLSINTGELVALLGASGSGKSTLLNLLGGIDAAKSGSLHIADQFFSSLPEPDLTLFRRQHIGFIYQLFNLIPTLSVFENIALPLELSGVTSAERGQRVTDWLDKVGLSGRETAFPDQLSGGEQQRVAIARALIHEPSLVLADEPTGNLDAVTGRKILDLLVSLSRDQGQTLLIVTHSQAVAELADRILVMKNGYIEQAVSGDENKSAW